MAYVQSASICDPLNCSIFNTQLLFSIRIKELFEPKAYFGERGQVLLSLKAFLRYLALILR